MSFRCTIFLGHFLNLKFKFKFKFNRRLIHFKMFLFEKFDRQNVKHES